MATEIDSQGKPEGWKDGLGRVADSLRFRQVSNDPLGRPAKGDPHGDPSHPHCRRSLAQQHLYDEIVA